MGITGAVRAVWEGLHGIDTTVWLRSTPGSRSVRETERTLWTELAAAGVPFERWNPEQQAKAVEDHYALQNDGRFLIDGAPIVSRVKNP